MTDLPSHSAPAVPALILAGGASTRLGFPKQLTWIDGERLVQRAVRVAREAGTQPVLVVLGAHADQILAECNLTDAIPVVNEHWQEGMASSIRVGLTRMRELLRIEAAVSTRSGPARPAPTGVILMVCDQPAVTASHLRRLMRTGKTTASGYKGRRGVPAFFAADALAALQTLQGDRGGRELLEDAPAIELPGGELDIDTAEDFARAADTFGMSAGLAARRQPQRSGPGKAGPVS